MKLEGPELVRQSAIVKFQQIPPHDSSIVIGVSIPAYVLRKGWTRQEVDSGSLTDGDGNKKTRPCWAFKKAWFLSFRGSYLSGPEMFDSRS
jgi:hypothetical protein